LKSTVAFKDINFLPERIVRLRRKKQQRKIASVVGAISFVIIVAAIWFPFYLASAYQDKIDEVDKEIKKLEPARPYFEEKQALEKDLIKKELVLQDIKGKQQKITEALQQVNTILPSGCFVTTLDIKAKEQFSVQVVTNNPVDTAKVMVGLRQLGIFDKVELSGVGDVPFTEGPQPVKCDLKFKGADIKDTKTKKTKK